MALPLLSGAWFQANREPEREKRAEPGVFSTDCKGNA